MFQDSPLSSIMEASPYRGLSELGTDDFSSFHQWMNSIDDISTIPMAGAFAENTHQTLYHPNSNFTSSMETSDIPYITRSEKKLKTNSWGSCITDSVPTPYAMSSPNILSFSNSNYTNQIVDLKPKKEPVSTKNYSSLPTGTLKSQGSFENQSYVSKGCQGGKRISICTRSSQNQDHVLAERKRREKLSQRFIALSAIVPGLKKTDKASVLGDAIKYLKHMQERVSILEEQARKKPTESAVYVRKSQLFPDNDNSSSEKEFSQNTYNEPLPEIEARSSDKNVLIRIHCEKKKGVTEKIIAHIEKLHLTVVNSSVMSFGDSTLDVTIIAQMDTDFCKSMKDLVKILRSSLI